MKTLYLLFITYILTIPLLFGQDCEVIVRENFDSEDATLPETWVESNSSGKVYIYKDALLMEFIKGDEDKATVTHNLPESLSGDFEVTFAFETGRNYYKNVVDFKTASGEYWLSLLLGGNSQKNIVLAESNNGAKPTDYPDENKLLEGEIQKNKIYEVKVSFKSDNTFSIFIDGVLEAESVALPAELTEELSIVEFTFSESFDDDTFKIEYFNAIKGITQNTFALQSLKTDIEQYISSIIIISGSEIIFDEENEDLIDIAYPEEEVITLQNELASAEVVLTTCVTQDIIDAEIISLQLAFDIFKANPADCGADFTALEKNIADSKTLLANATIGDNIGEYPEYNKVELESAILVGESIVGNCITQDEVEVANDALTAATDNFKNNIVKDNSSIDCAEIINHNFNLNGDVLPSGWTEVGENNLVTIVDNQLTSEITTSGEVPTVQYTMPNHVGNSFDIEFVAMASRDWFTNRIDFLTKNGKYWFSLKIGDGGTKNIIYGINNAGDKPTSFPNSNKLIDQFVKNTPYTIHLKVNEYNTLSIYINGELKASDIQLPQALVDPIATIQSAMTGIYSNNGFYYMDDFKLFKGARVDMFSFNNKIVEIETYLNEKVTVGDNGGQYKQEDVDLMHQKIEEAKTKSSDCSLTAEDVLALEEELQNDFDSFKKSVILIYTDVKLTVNTNTVLTKKDPLWLGGNSIYNDGGQGLWNVEENHAEYDVIDRSNFTGASLYRFPGGSMANLYRWKKAIGPVDQRGYNMDSHKDGAAQVNTFGPDEFGQLLNTTFINQGIVVVAFQYETPEDAGDYVEYMNAKVGDNPNGGKDWALERAKNGRYEPYNIKLWEIGNEMYGDWELSVFNYPETGDEVRGGDRIVKGDAQYYVRGGSRAFTNQTAVSDASWLNSDTKTTGEASQVLYVKFAPVDLSATFSLRINNQSWTRVDNLYGSLPTDRHFTVDAKTGAITFGDGRRGMIPAEGSNVYLDYTSGPHASFSDYYDAMKAVDPSIQVISCFEKEDFYKYMAQDNKPYDGVSFHFYPNLQLEEGDIPDEDHYKRGVWEGTRVKRQIAKQKGWVEKYDNPSLAGKDVKIHMTEFGGRKDLLAIPFIATMFHDIANYHSGNLGTSLIHSYFKNDNTPMVDPRYDFVSAKAIAYHIFGQLHQDTFVSVDYDGDTYSYDGGLGGETEVIQKTFATATVNDAGDVFTLVVPNLTDTEIIKLTVDIKDYPFSSDDEVILKRWHTVAEDVFANNSNSENDNLQLVLIDTLEAKAQFTTEVPAFTTAVYQWSVKEGMDITKVKSELTEGLFAEGHGFASDSVMKVNGFIYDQGFSLFNESRVFYHLDSNCSSFSATVGLDDAFTEGSTEINIYGDNQLLYSQIFGPNTPEEKIKLDVTNVARLEFETVAQEGINCFAIFGEARVVLGDGKSPVTDIDDDFLKDELDWIIHPNPFVSDVNVTISKNVSGILKLYDLTGRLVYTEQVNAENALHLDMHALRSGIYVLRLEMDDQSLVSKIIKY
ncbi:NPCBM/NEW2 domain-containing protein [Flammeovirga sp. SubArs3]|uniref:NPCBM/NEW2 domain-containing protein n=1 Tax=Flammeovirga sp. SubArs3 TaxID=2995316 RepID=UPI00248CB18C|nr:NPCBM/NEW2 domain-containing protein [Flammeovirga sp. SubArs3]